MNRRRTLPRPAFRPRLLALEGRDVPAVVNWTPGADGNFANAAAWTDQVNGTHHVPGPTDDAVIPSAFSVSSSANQTVNSLSATNFQFLGGTFTINGAVTASTLITPTFAAGATIALAGNSQYLVIDGPLLQPNFLSLANTFLVGTGGGVRFRHGYIHLDPGFNFVGNGLFLIDGDTLGGSTVTLNTDLTAPPNVVLANGVLDGPGTLTVPSGATFSLVTPVGRSARLNGPGSTVIQAGGTMLIGGLNGEVLDRLVTNNGTIAYQQAPNGGALNFGVSGRIDNNAGAAIHLETDIAIGGSPAGTSVINNAGTITKTTAGTLNFNGLDFNNAGTVAVQSGTLGILFGGGTHTGAFTIAAGAGLTFGGDAFEPKLLNAGAIISGPGLLTFATQSATPTQLNIGASIDVNTPVLVAGGTFQVNTPQTLSNFTLLSGVLEGTGELTLSNTATWTGGIMRGTGSTTLTAGATLAISGGNGKTLTQRTLNVGGTVNHTGGTLDLGIGAGTVVNVLPSGVFNLAVDTPLNGGGATINNQGLFVKSSPTGTGGSSMQHVVNNTGTIRVDSGTLTLVALPLPSVSTFTGAFVVAAGAGLTFGGNTQNVNAGASFSGAGLVSLTGGTLNVNANVSLANFSLAGGILGGTGTVTLAGPATWTVGSMTGTGTTAVAAGVTLTLSGASTRGLTGSRVLDVSGAVNQAGGNFDLASTASMVVRPGGTYTLPIDANIGAGGGTITNQGLFVKSSPTGTGASQVNHHFTNAGTLRVDSGTLWLQLSAGQTAGTTTVASGATLRATSFALSGGTLGGNGTVLGNVTGAGSVSPGTSPGRLTVNGNVNLGGPFVVELNGVTAGSQYDRLAVNGTVTLGGPLSLSAGFAAAAGAQFVVIDNDGSAAVTGTFAGLSQGATVTANGQAFTVSYAGGTGNDVVLMRSSGPAAPPRVTGVTENAGQANTAQRSRVTSLSVTFDSQVTFAGGDVAAAFGLSRIGGAAVGGFTATAAVVNGVTVVTLSGFTGAETQFGSLADGRYSILVRANLVSSGGLQLDGDGNGTGGDDYSLAGSVANGLYRLFGDVNADGVINAFDFGQFRNAFGASVGDAAYRDYLDLNGDGAINAFDFGQFRNRFGGGVP